MKTVFIFATQHWDVDGSPTIDWLMNASCSKPAQQLTSPLNIASQVKDAASMMSQQQLQQQPLQSQQLQK
jgi:hypothetical protein